MRVLLIHNRYGEPSGEEHALEGIGGLLTGHGNDIGWFQCSSEEIKRLSGKGRAFFSGIHSAGSARRLRRQLDRSRADAALVQNLYPLLSPSVLPVLKEFGIPVVMRCPNYRLFCPNGLHLSHGEVCERCLGGKEYWCVLRNCEGDLFKSLGYALRNMAARITRRIVDNVDRFVVLTEFQQQRFVDGGIPQERVKVVPNVIPTVSGSSSDETGDLVSFIGRISTEKGIEDFVAAAGRLARIPFAVAGDASRMPELKKRSPENIRWAGFLEGEELDDLFSRSRILVFPSNWYEGFPNVITRAMMHRKPVIAARLGGVPEIIDDGRCGLLFESGNVAQLTERIGSLYDDPAKCRELGLAGRAKAATEYSLETVYRKWMAVFDDTIRSSKKRLNRPNAKVEKNRQGMFFYPHAKNEFSFAYPSCTKRSSR